MGSTNYIRAASADTPNNPSLTVSETFDCDDAYSGTMVLNTTNKRQVISCGDDNNPRRIKMIAIKNTGAVKARIHLYDDALATKAAEICIPAGGFVVRFGQVQDVDGGPARNIWTRIRGYTETSTATLQLLVTW